MATSSNKNDHVFPASKQQLPLELIGQIFYYSLPLYSARRPSRKLSPISLCQVSRAWRNTARSLTDLWERLLLRQDPFQSPFINAQKFIAASALWLEHRKNRPIDLQFDFDFDIWPHPVFTNAALQNLEIPIAPNVRDFCLEINSEAQSTDWAIEKMVSLDALEAFSLSDLTYEPIQYNPPFPTLLHARKLRMVSLSICGDTMCRAGQLPVPWAQITHLCLPHQMPCDGWHQLIRSCPQLEHCYVGFENIGDEMDAEGEVDPSTLQPVSLTALRSLTVGFHGTGFSPDVFTMVTCPHIEALSIISEDLDAGFLRTEQPLDFYLRSASTIQSLRLTRQKISASDVLDVLRVAVGLRNLSLDCQGDHNCLLNAIEIKKPVSNGTDGIDIDMINVIPQLQTFSLRISQDSSLFASSFVTAMVSRWNQATRHGGPFAWAELHVDEIHRDLYIDVNNLVAGYRKQGLAIKVDVVDWVEGGEVAKARDDAWESWRLDRGLISL
ncbi:hypothetical protein H0H87_002629 [Tephrocybe sp. NHM501043]|nr:hypothetical protein H0H87_002629 [Tephrocybe sp. NHM501043]